MLVRGAVDVCVCVFPPALNIFFFEPVSVMHTTCINPLTLAALAFALIGTADVNILARHSRLKVSRC